MTPEEIRAAAKELMEQHIRQLQNQLETGVEFEPLDQIVTLLTMLSVAQYSCSTRPAQHHPKAELVK